MAAHKNLKRQYLEASSRAGVYAIRHLSSGRALVAGSTDAQGMLNRHRFELRHGVHRNARLARDWNEQGESGFLFELLDTVTVRDDPGFNLATELAALVELWRQEIPCCDQFGYGAAARNSR